MVFLAGALSQRLHMGLHVHNCASINYRDTVGSCAWVCHLRTNPEVAG
jgi:hypothetical protein